MVRYNAMAAAAWQDGNEGRGSREEKKTGQHLNVYLRDCPRAEECPHEFVEVSTQE